MAPLAIQHSGTRTGILSPSRRDGIVPIAFGVDDSRGVSRYAGREIHRVGVGAIAPDIHQVRARLKRVEWSAVRVVGGLGEVGGGDGVAGSSRCGFPVQVSFKIGVATRMNCRSIGGIVRVQTFDCLPLIGHTVVVGVGAGSAGVDNGKAADAIFIDIIIAL